MEVFEKEGDWEAAQPGIVKRSFTGQHITYVRYLFEPGATFALHRHAQEQLCLLEYGTLTCTIDKQRVSLTAREVMLIPVNVPHTMSAGDSGALLNCVLSPPRSPLIPLELLPEVHA